jgi:TatD DNase family protein
LPRDLKPKPSHRRNEPKFLPHIVRAIAAARGEDPVTLAETTTRNAIRFFGLDGVVDCR